VGSEHFVRASQGGFTPMDQHIILVLIDIMASGGKTVKKRPIKFGLHLIKRMILRKIVLCRLTMINSAFRHVYVRRKPVKTRQNANEDFLCAFIHCANSGLYPFANQTRFTLLALEAANK
jgi:hypothetical protein